MTAQFQLNLQGFRPSVQDSQSCGWMQTNMTTTHWLSLKRNPSLESRQSLRSISLKEMSSLNGTLSEVGSSSNTKTRTALLLLSHAWVCLPPNTQESQLTDTTWWWREVQCLLWGSQQGVQELMLKRLKLLSGFQGKIFKDKTRARIAGYVTSLWTSFWWVGGEVIGSQYQQLSRSNLYGAYVLWAACS